MNKNTLIFVNKNVECEAFLNETIASLAQKCGVNIDQPCGGTGSCGKCRIMIEGPVADPTDKDKAVFSEEELNKGYRLACITQALPGMKVTLLDENEKSAKILEGINVLQDDSPADLSSELGIAVDIGTTTVVAYLVDLKGGLLAVTSSINPQVAFGADVISRISYCERESDNLNKMQISIINQINKMIDEVVRSAGVNKSQIKEIVVAGNTTMEHIFAGCSPTSIGRAPFLPLFYSGPELIASDLGLSLKSDVKVRLLPNISGFIGGDIVAGIVYSKMTEKKELSLLLDIGTNNEMVLGNKDFLYCTSAAAGPALEGAKITQGMRAANGAIDSVAISGNDLTVTVIGNIPAKGICGSGLVDAVAEMLKSGVITKSGKFNKPENLDNSKLATRLRGTKASEMTFTLFEKTEEDNEYNVSLRQKDVREVQLAKGAIATGIELLLKETGHSINDIDNIYIAGAFGNYLNFEKAIKIGILPEIQREKIYALGNSAGLGACSFLSEENLWEKAKVVMEKAKLLELPTHKDFQDAFVRNLSF